MRYYFILLASIACLSSCSNSYKPKQIPFFENDSIPLIEKLRKIVETNYLIELGFDQEETSWLQQFYQQRKYKPLWINDSTLNDNGISLDSTLNRALYFGIPDNRVALKLNEKRLWLQKELILTAKIAYLFKDLNNGFLALDTKKYQPKQFYNLDSVNYYLAQSDTISFDAIFLKQGPLDTNYRFFAHKLYSYCQSHTMDKNTFKIKALKEDSLNGLKKTKAALLSKGYLNDSTVNDPSLFIQALKEFQADNGLRKDGVIGKYTALALNESTYHKVLRAALTLEKIRQAKKYPEKCIRINIPEYTLRYYVHDSLKRIHNIVVGKPENQTPELTSKVINIIAYPYWNVPYSIASKEILPDVKQNSNYIAKNHYKLYRGDHEVNPSSVNWRRVKDKTFPYKIVQQPGPKNSLGIIKFEFYSNYSVYLHDTPSKYLFGTDIRAYSHGCMRCQDPVDLGKTILDYDSLKLKRNMYTADSLDTILSREKNFKIKLKDPIPIFVEYFSVVADREKIIFFPDIYARDEEYLTIFKKK